MVSAHSILSQGERQRDLPSNARLVAAVRGGVRGRHNPLPTSPKFRLRGAGLRILSHGERREAEQ